VYVLAVEGAIGAVLVIQAAGSHLYFTSAAYAQFTLMPLPIELAVAGPVLAFIAWRFPARLLRFAVAAGLVVAALNTLLWLVAFLAWFVVGCGGGLFCHGGPLGG